MLQAPARVIARETVRRRVRPARVGRIGDRLATEEMAKRPDSVRNAHVAIVVGVSGFGTGERWFVAEENTEGPQRVGEIQRTVTARVAA